MKPYVDIEGSGENVTTITGGVTGQAGVVQGASHAELRLLTVENIVGGYAYGIYNKNNSPKITSVTVNVVTAGGAASYAMFNENASPVLTHVTLNASSGDNNHGLYNQQSSPVMDNVIANASGGYGAFGISNYLSSPVMMNVVATASGGGTYNNGITSDGTSLSGSSPIIINSRALAIGTSGASANFALYITGTSATTTLINTTLEAAGTGSNYGIYLRGNSTTVDMTGGTVSASGSDWNYGALNACFDQKGVIKMNSAVVKGSTASLYGTGSTYAAYTKLDGPVNSSLQGIFKCLGTYNGTYDPVICQ